MPSSTDAPPRAAAQRRRYIILLVVLVLILMGRQTLGTWLESGIGHVVALTGARAALITSSLRFAGSLLTLFIVIAIIVSLVRQSVEALARLAASYLGIRRSRTLASLVSFFVYLLLIPLAVAWVLGIDLTGLAVGGALTGVVLGIAAQASLGNLIAGLVILFARPFSLGMYVTVRSPQFMVSEYSGRVEDISLFYTTLISADRETRIPNAAMLGSAITVRAAELEMVLPLVLPAGAVYHATLENLHRAITTIVGATRPVTIVLDRAESVGRTITVRLSVTTGSERTRVEQAILDIFDAIGQPTA